MPVFHASVLVLTMNFITTYFDAISFPEPTCLLVSTKAWGVLTKRHVGSGEKIDFDDVIMLLNKW